ncbi:GBS Bsp-like repeat-containing protein [Acetobacterium woodii]|uniref:Amidase n=1 Tax=Acetobacterium woodii (strain ATCC 29683 / DSM 1030 / JCM 2381 / KCTC 1655 / WB1) TaxID=931626 RepID=H6LGA9_ACEWD|nr:GBS Bsp-like repeat-containing protein [Acetobacterium woodii]AFA47045.1 amidase [Acetobacterium woodii DSM 1030]
MEIIRNRKKQIALGIVMTLVLLTFFSYFSLDVKAASTTIVVNPGHLDGVDTGAVNKSNGIREVDLNNALAIKVVSTLRQNGYNAMLSHPVPGNPGLPTLLSAPPAYSAYSTTICNKANQIGADLLISIHHNSGAATASGYEFYWSSYHPSVDTNGIYQKPGLWSDGSLADLDATPPTIALKSKELANLLNDNFSENLTYVPSRDKIIERDDAITRKTSMPSVLIEAGYVSNNAEVVKMADDNNQQQMANQILASINELFGANTDLMTATSFTASVNGDKITATVNGVSAPNGLQVIYIPVWSDDGGQDDLKWYPATKQGDGSYSATIDVKDHGYESGNYQLHCYGVDSYGKYTLLGHTTVNVTSSVQEKMTASSVTGTVSGNKITATVKGISAPNGLTGITIPVWSETGGQDDLKWYSATKQSDGSYRVTIDIKDHNYDGGLYNIHAYGIDNNGKMTFLGNTSATVKVDTMTATSVSASVSGNKITAMVKGITAPNGITEVIIPIWSETNGQDDLKWYPATKQSDGSYAVTIDIRDHNNDGGTYNIHAYGKDNNNKMTFVGSTSVNVLVEPMTATSVTASVSGNKITTVVKGIKAPNGLKSIAVPIWSDVNGQDDLKWYTATKQSDGSYAVTIDIKDHNYSGGVYNIHVYGTDDSGKQTFLGNTSVSVATTPMSATSVKASVAENMITVVVSGITAPNGIKKIEIPTWSDINGQDDLIWYTATEQSDGSYKVVIDAKNHHGDSGTYLIDAYGVESDGRFVPLGSTSASVRYVETPIMGETTVTAAELVAYYKASGSVYPQIYNDLGVNLEKFVDLYIQECKVEGVRAEVAFAQAMLETGNLQFGGDVKVTQFNFAGLGATGGVPGFDFSVVYGNNSTGLQTGIRGHVQHLKCYACDEDLKQTNVDPRWNDKIRLRALSVEELAGTWAADTTYATKIKAIMKKF